MDASCCLWRETGQTGDFAHPPQLMSTAPPRMSEHIALHSMCHPGRPSPHGLCHLGSPSLLFFHRTKSDALFFSEESAASAPSPSMAASTSSRGFCFSLPYLGKQDPVRRRSDRLYRPWRRFVPRSVPCDGVLCDGLIAVCALEVSFLHERGHVEVNGAVRLISVAWRESERLRTAQRDSVYTSPTM